MGEREGLVGDLRRRVLFARAMIRAPRIVGAVWPTSRRAVRDLLDMGDLPSARTVVEFGTGTGVYTTEILKRLGPDATFLAFEINADLARVVTERLGADRRLRVVNVSAEHVDDYLEGAKADYVVSSVPFTTLPTDARHGLLDAARRALAPDGRMLVLQYSNTVLPDLRRVFPAIHRRFSPLNVPPAFLFACSASEADTQKDAGRESRRSRPVALAVGGLLLLLVARGLVRRRRS